MNTNSILYILLFSFFSVFATAQVSYTASDFADSEEEYIFSVGNLPIGVDFSATGENYIWDYSDITYNSQTNSEWIDPTTSGYQLSWCFLNGYLFTCNSQFADLTNLASRDFEGIEINGFGLTNVVTHYKKSSNTLEARMLGVQPDFSGLTVPFPAQYSNPDTIYQFPIEYQNTNNSTSAYAIDFTQFNVGFVFNSANSRSNTVEGYGSLTTPYGTFDEVLKMKTIVETQNIIVYEDFEVPTNYTTVEYKWFSKDHGMPVMTASGNVTLLGEVITSVSYIDSIRCIQPVAVAFSTPLQVYAEAETYDASVTFTNFSQNADDYFWNFGDGNTSNTKNPSHTYDCPGDYEVLLVANNTACEGFDVQPDTLTLTVAVQDTLPWNIEAIEGGLKVIPVSSNATYQWVDCDNDNSPIDGAIGDIFYPLITGNYGVVATVGSCTFETDCQMVIVSDIDEALQEEISISPNPTTGRLNINLGNTRDLFDLKIIDVTGQVLKSQSIRTNNTLDLDLPNGVYYLHLENEEGRQVVKRIAIMH